MTIEGSPLSSIRKQKNVPRTVGFLPGRIQADMKKRQKTYQQYKDEAKARNDSIMSKYGAPEGAKPPLSKDALPATSDRDYRRFALLRRRTLESWPKGERRY